MTFDAALADRLAPPADPAERGARRRVVLPEDGADTRLERLRRSLMASEAGEDSRGEVAVGGLLAAGGARVGAAAGASSFSTV